MKARQWIAIGGVASISACSNLDSGALFGEATGGGGAPATTASTGGTAASAPQSPSVAGTSATSSLAGNSAISGNAASNAGGEGGASSLAGEGGGDTSSAGGTAPTPNCADTCVNGTCTTGAVVKCECSSGFVPEGLACRRPKSCQELHRAWPNLANGAYSLQPVATKEAFQSYCLMSAEGGGWTLVLNQGTEFDPSAMGAASELAYEGKGTNLAYSSVALESDVLLDVRMDSIASETYTARAVILGVHAGTRGRTVRELFTSGPYYLEAEDNSNLTLASSRQCNFSPVELGPLFCQAPVIVLGNQEANCRPAVPRFAISGAGSYTQAWSNCAGWPQATVVNGQQHFPNNFRVWIR